MLVCLDEAVSGIPPLGEGSTPRASSFPVRPVGTGGDRWGPLRARRHCSMAPGGGEPRRHAPPRCTHDVALRVIGRGGRSDT